MTFKELSGNYNKLAKKQELLIMKSNNQAQMIKYLMKANIFYFLRWKRKAKKAMKENTELKNE
jgi:hypothetical protein